MQFLDFSQVLFGQIHTELARQNETLNEDLIRHLAINQIRSYNKKYRSKFGEMIICIDSLTGYWRKQVFPFYKWKRAEDRKTDNIDWPTVFAAMDKIRDEIREELPFITLCVDKCEADDIIGVLVRRMTDELNLIISSDNDFRQLQVFDNHQWSPITKQNIIEKQPEFYLFQHVMRGDGGDGIPNIKTPSDFFKQKADGLLKRQTPISEKWINKKWSEYREIGDQTFRNEGEAIYQRWQENLQLIDLVHKIPPDIEDSIWTEFIRWRELNPTRTINLYKYFRQNRMVRLIEDIADFDIKTGEQNADDFADASSANENPTLEF